FYLTCLFQFHLFCSLGSSEFFLLGAIAYDRYVSICKPLQYREVKRKAAQTCLPHLIVLIIFFCLCAYDVIIVGLEPDFTKIDNYPKQSSEPRVAKDIGLQLVVGLWLKNLWSFSDRKLR
ncbi:olfactory receptor 6C65-like, partial [Anableps anableps]